MVSIKLLLLAVLLIIGCVAIHAEEEQGHLIQAVRSVDSELEEYARDAPETDEEILQQSRQRRGGNPCSPASSSGGSSGSATSAPTTKPTNKPTNAPSTSAPTTKPTNRPTNAPSTSAPTTKPTNRPTNAPSTSAPTTKPTSKPTSAPTTKPTTKPTTAPTTKPTSSSSSGSSSSGSSSGSSVGLCDSTTEPTKLLVPLYTYPGSTWDTVAAGASKVPTIAIINPNSGPSSSGPDSSYNTYMTKLKNAGVEMVGYVYTSYGARSISDVQKDIDTYASKYPGVTGIFFDEASDATAQISFYTQAYNYVMGKGMKHSILNPGVQPAQGYTSISTSIVVFEDAGSKVSSLNFASWVTCAPTAAQKTGYKYKFSGIAHSTSSSSASSILSSFKSKGIGMVYVTDGAAGCCTYNDLVSYYATEATNVQSLNA